MSLRFLSFIIFYLSFSVALHAQKLEVKEMTQVLNDPAATQYPVKDYNGNNCALIIVGLAADGIEFEGNVIRQERKPNGEYWVYVTDGTLDLQISSKEFLPEEVSFHKFGITSLTGGTTYRMNVERPLLEATFDDLLETARKYYNERSAHADYNYYEAARIAYDNAINHNDCPPEQREAVRQERDTMTSIRNNVYLIEQAAKVAGKHESEKGFDSDEVYKYLGAQVNFADRILRYHPECTAVSQLRSHVLERLRVHPRGTEEVGQDTIMKKRETLSGTVSFKNKHRRASFSEMLIFATSSSDIQDARSCIIGRVNADGTYSVVKPDDVKPLYIYVTGEKDDAHYVADGTTHFDIIIK